MRRVQTHPANSLLVTGGAGFIGSNAARHFARQGWRVAVLDNMSRRGAADNVAWLNATGGVHAVELHVVDTRDADGVAALVRALRPAALIHCAGQVAVTTSVADPRADFESNALGTFNMLEAVRHESPDTFVINASTNKVYGKLETLGVVERDGRYAFAAKPGVAEDATLDFISPYGCSKGVADQYVLDYARIYGLGTVTFRQSCIYGPRQFGIEDQGWVAWFTIAAMLGKPITLYGDGRQVRDILHIDDLVAAYAAAIDRREAVRGEAFNIGGGPGNTLSLLELLAHLRARPGNDLRLTMRDWRPGDQRVYVSDIGKAEVRLGWRPTIGVTEGVDRLAAWVREHRALFTDL